MRFVAGRDAVAKLLPAVALRRRAIGKLLLAGAPWRSDCREAALWQRGWPGRCCGEASRGADVERQTVGADALVNERTCKRNAAREMLPQAKRRKLLPLRR